MVSAITSSLVDRMFWPQLDQLKDYLIGIIFFYAKHAALRSKSKTKTGWLGIQMCQSGVSCLSADCCYSELAP